MKRTAFALFFALPLVFTACQKTRLDAVSTLVPVTPSPAPVSGNVLKDSVLLVSKDIYLWNTQLPATFNPRNYDDPVKIMESIRQYSIEPGFNQPVDRYSFAIKKTEWDNLSTGMSSVATATSENGDLGLTVFFRTEGDLRVRLVEPNSPAGLAGIHRGWKVTQINASTNIKRKCNGDVCAQWSCDVYAQRQDRAFRSTGSTMDSCAIYSGLS